MAVNSLSMRYFVVTLVINLCFHWFTMINKMISIFKMFTASGSLCSPDHWPLSGCCSWLLKQRAQVCPEKLLQVYLALLSSAEPQPSAHRSWGWTEGYAETPEVIPAFFSYAALISICDTRNFTLCWNFSRANSPAGAAVYGFSWGFFPPVLANQCFVPEETGWISLQCQTEVYCGLIQVFYSKPFPSHFLVLIMQLSSCQPVPLVPSLCLP